MTKPITYFLGASVALAIQCAPAVAAMAHSPDEIAVRAVTEQFAADLAKGDLKAISLLYTDDAKLLPPNATAISGRAAIFAYFKKNLRPDIVSHAKFSHYEIYSGDDAAASLSELKMYDGNGNIVEQGRQTIILIKQGGEWKIHRDMWSDDTPAKVCN